MRITLLTIGVSAVLMFEMAASEPPWDPSRVKDCNRECLLGIMDGYMNAMYKHDLKAVPP
jgi:hypothetical protein